MEDAASWGLIIGVVTPYLVALVNQPSWSDTARRVTAVLVAVAVGLGNAYFNGDIDFEVETVLASIAAVLVASQTVYRNVLKPLPSGVTALEHATSPGSSRDRKV